MSGNLTYCGGVFIVDTCTVASYVVIIMPCVVNRAEISYCNVRWYLTTLHLDFIANETLADITVPPNILYNMY